MSTSEIVEAGETTIVRHPSWTGTGFREPSAQAYWAELAASLQLLARAEFAAGNSATQILRNHARGIVLLGFATGPLAAADLSGLRVHTTHAFGNYCYDGTRCTIEDPATGCFVAFDSAADGEGE